MAGRRHFGSVRRLPSGRYQASYCHRATRHVAPRTFPTKSEAHAWLATVQTDILKGAWVSPNAGALTLAEWGSLWLANRHDLRPRTRELYGYLLRDYIVLALGPSSLADLSPGRIRSWHAKLAAERPALAPKAYRLLRTLLGAAVEDRRITTNPCQIKRAASEHPVERPTASVAEVEAIADAIDNRYRAMVLLAVWCSLRFGELAALTRRRIDLVHGVVDVQETLTETASGKHLLGRPKTDAGRRTVAIPPHLRPELSAHHDRYVGSQPDAPVFPGPEGDRYLRRSNFTRRVWKPATATIGVSLRFHDLRHSGLTWSAATGATVAELMRRAGHASPRAALIYQHATEDRDHALAAALSAMRQPSKPVPLDKRPRIGG
jgi:integrase